MWDQIRSFFNLFRYLIKFLQFSIHARTLDELDSPLLYQLAASLYHPPSILRTAERELLELRKTLRKDFTRIPNGSYGAGSRAGAGKSPTVGSLIDSAVSRPFKCRQLCSLIDYFGARHVLELGTSLGIMTRYMAQMPSVEYIHTVEGNPAIAQYTRDHIFKNESKIWLEQNSFRSAIHSLISNERRFDLIYLDGSHTFTDTIEFVDLLNSILKDDGIIVVDDLYWSDQMGKAWEHILSNNTFNLKINCFHYGVIGHLDSLVEPITCELLPHKVRWKTGLFR
jgi:predicted O-methyltransferase YrrM